MNERAHLQNLKNTHVANFDFCIYCWSSLQNDTGRCFSRMPKSLFDKSAVGYRASDQEIFASRVTLVGTYLLYVRRNNISPEDGSELFYCFLFDRIAKYEAQRARILLKRLRRCERAYRRVERARFSRMKFLFSRSWQSVRAERKQIQKECAEIIDAINEYINEIPSNRAVRQKVTKTCWRILIFDEIERIIEKTKALGDKISDKIADLDKEERDTKRLNYTIRAFYVSIGIGFLSLCISVYGLVRSSGNANLINALW